MLVNQKYYFLFTGMIFSDIQAFDKSTLCMQIKIIELTNC